MPERLKDKSVLVTQSTDFMGPAINDLFTQEAAQVDARPGVVPFGEAFDEYVTGLADIDILIANLAHAPCNGPTAAILDTDWMSMFDTMVHPLMRLIRHFAPLMAIRGYGKIVCMTSAAPLRGMPGSRMRLYALPA
jgi:2-keto-3-deoxy-L-fuconate dehydrogenase